MPRNMEGERLGIHNFVQSQDLDQSSSYLVVAVCEIVQSEQHAAILLQLLDTIDAMIIKLFAFAYLEKGSENDTATHCKLVHATQTYQEQKTRAAKP